MADCLAELLRQRQVAFALMLSTQRPDAAASSTQPSQEQSQEAAACAAGHTAIEVHRKHGAAPQTQAAKSVITLVFSRA